MGILLWISLDPGWRSAVNCPHMIIEVVSMGEVRNGEGRRG